jgi:hypothetical protein
MLEVIHCPSCQRQLCLPEELAGRAVQCPACRQTFQTAAPHEAAPVHLAESTAGTDEVSLSLSLDEARPPRRLQNVPPPPAPLRPVPLDPSFAAPAANHLVPCPHGGEAIPPGAEHCRICGLDLDEDDDETPAPADPLGLLPNLEPHRGRLILTLGIISVVALVSCGLIGLPCGLAAWTMGRTDLRKMDVGQMDPEGRDETWTGQACGRIGTVLDMLWVLGVGYWLLGR